MCLCALCGETQNKKAYEKANSNIRFYRLYRDTSLASHQGTSRPLQVIKEHPDLYEVYALTANNKADLLAQQAREFMPEAVVIANEDKYVALKEALSDLPIKVYAGKDALAQIVESKPIDIVLTAMVGYAGLLPTMRACFLR